MFDDLNKAGRDISALVAKLDKAIDPAEIRELIATLNRVSGNLLEISEKLKGVLK